MRRTKAEQLDGSGVVKAGAQGERCTLCGAHWLTPGRVAHCSVCCAATGPLEYVQRHFREVHLKVLPARQQVIA